MCVGGDGPIGVHLPGAATALVVKQCTRTLDDGPDQRERFGSDAIELDVLIPTMFPILPCFEILDRSSD